MFIVPGQFEAVIAQRALQNVFTDFGKQCCATAQG